jgi:DnaJ family protein C protein 30
LFLTDVNHGSEDSHNRFSEISAAYEVLGSYELRKKYDKGVLYNYPNPDYQHPHHRTQHQTKSNMYGKKVQFDFDEFYRAHYGETVRRRQKEERERREEAARAESQVLTENQQAGLRLVIIAMVLAAGWVGHYLAVKDSKPKPKT